MENNTLKNTIERILSAIQNHIPAYMKNPDDKQISEGNVAICIIDGEGNIYGRYYGTDKLKTRRSYQLAWTKASQVWITGYKTGEYEKKIFNNEISEEQYGIGMPDMIGWEGGQPIVLSDGTLLAVGFSGFRGVSDLDIVLKTVAEVEKLKKN